MQRHSRRLRRVLAGLIAAALSLSPLGAGPATADDPANAGGGSFSGSISFSGAGIPPVNTPCRGTSFSIDVAATITLANGEGSFGTWLLTPPAGANITGSGHSTCENSTIGGGRLSLAAIDVVNPVTSSRLRCGLDGAQPLEGAFTRVATDVTAVLGGECFIDNFDVGKVAIYIRGEFTPSPLTGNGITTNVTQANVAGTFTVVPAGSVG